MLPDFSKPAFDFAILSMLHFYPRSDDSRGDFRSDLRTQCRITKTVDPDGAPGAPILESRAHFVGKEATVPDETVPSLIAFLDPSSANAVCRVGDRIELIVGQQTIASGVVLAVARRPPTTSRT